MFFSTKIAYLFCRVNKIAGKWKENRFLGTFKGFVEERQHIKMDEIRQIVLVFHNIFRKFRLHIEEKYIMI